MSRYRTALSAFPVVAALAVTGLSGGVAQASPEVCDQFGSAVAAATADAESINTLNVLAKGQRLLGDVDGLTAQFGEAGKTGRTCADGDGNAEVNARYLQLRKTVLGKKEVLTLFFFWEPVAKSMKQADAAYPDAVEDAPDLAPTWDS